MNRGEKSGESSIIAASSAGMQSTSSGNWNATSSSSNIWSSTKASESMPILSRSAIVAIAADLIFQDTWGCRKYSAMPKVSSCRRAAS